MLIAFENFHILAQLLNTLSTHLLHALVADSSIFRVNILLTFVDSIRVDVPVLASQPKNSEYLEFMLVKNIHLRSRLLLSTNH